MDVVYASQMMAENWTVGRTSLKQCSSTHSSLVGDLLKALSAWWGGVSVKFGRLPWCVHGVSLCEKAVSKLKEE